MRPIHDEVDLFYRLAECLENNDHESLQFIERTVRDWLQSSELTAAQIALIEAIRGAMYED